VAVFEGDLNMLVYLYEHGADFTIKNQLGDNPLQASCASVSPQIIAWVNEHTKIPDPPSYP
jgi:ankyrin repeat protein